MGTSRPNSDFIKYILDRGLQPGSRLPALGQMSQELGISVGKLREQMEVARSLGIVEVRPRTGIRCESYDFFPAIRASLLYALAIDRSHFDTFSDLRNHVESSFWHEAVARLQESDKVRLRQLMAGAWAKLKGHPIQIPHAEHRDLHLTIFSRLDNPFVKGLLEAYWEAYEAAELDVYSDYQYLQDVWTYHQKIVDAILSGERDAGQAALVEHTRLLRYRDAPRQARELKPAEAPA